MATLQPNENEKDISHVHRHENILTEDGKVPAVDYSGAHKKVDPAEIRLVKKLDLWIMPTLWAMYWLNFLDRNAIALARLDNLEEELGLSDSQYATCVSILFVGYILAQVPSNMLLTRIRISWYMGGCMILWAIVSTLTGITKDYTGLLLTRFFLGITEAPYYPGALYIISIFYTRKEIATRISILYTGNVLATAFAPLISIGVFKMGGVAGLSGWRWLFILQGIATFAVAVISLFLLPDDPTKTWWLTPEERELAQGRIDSDTVENQGASSTWDGLKQALKDKKVWMFVLMQHMHVGALGFKNFFPTAVASLGFDRTLTLVLTCPPYLIAGIVAVLYSAHSGKKNERTWHITASKSVAIFGFILACSTLNTGARYFAMVVFATGTYGVNSIILGWVASTCCQTKEKKAVSLAIVNMTSNASFIWTAYLWPSWDKPRYVVAMGSSAGLSMACVLGAWCIKWMLMRENRRIRAQNNENVLFYAY